MQRHELEHLSREELIALAERLGIARPRVLTQPELIDEILTRTTASKPELARARGWFGRARDLLASVVDRGLHLPDVARVLRATPASRPTPAPRAPLATVTLAEIYAAQGHLDRAITVLDELLSREPNHDAARKLRDRFSQQATRPTARSVQPETERPHPPAQTPAVAIAAPSGDTGAVSPAGDEADDQHKAAVEPPAAAEQPAAPDEAVEAPAEQPAAQVQAVEAPAEQPAAPDEAVEAPAEQPAAPDEAVEAPAEQPAAPDEAVEAPAEQPAPQEQVAAPQQAVEAPAEQPAAQELIAAPQQAAEAPAEQPAATDEAAAAPTDEAAAAPDQTASAALPPRYNVNEVVAIAVDPATVYFYWEVRPATLARLRAPKPTGALIARIVSVTASWQGPRIDQRDVRLDRLYGDHTERGIPSGSHVRVSIGWVCGADFDPIAIGADVEVPHALETESMAFHVGQWTLDPSRSPGAPASLSAPAMFAVAGRAARRGFAGAPSRADVPWPWRADPLVTSWPFAATRAGGMTALGDGGSSELPRDDSAAHSRDQAGEPAPGDRKAPA